MDSPMGTQKEILKAILTEILRHSGLEKVTQKDLLMN